MDKIFNLKVKKEDRIAVNFPYGKINLVNHPIKKFIDFSHSLGLQVDFLDNHPMDFNKTVYDIFDGTTHSIKLKSHFMGSDQRESITDIYQEEWESIDIANRFNGYRFAFGSRLHSFLPFLAFEAPSSFVTPSQIRQSIPYDYFGNNYFLSKFSYNSKNPEIYVDSMIESLKFFIKEEEFLVDLIKESKYNLWNITMNNKNELLSKI